MDKPSIAVPVGTPAYVPLPEHAPLMGAPSQVGQWSTGLFDCTSDVSQCKLTSILLCAQVLLIG